MDIATECMGPPPTLSVVMVPGVTKVINNSGACKVLGVHLQANTLWAVHLEKGENALLPSLRRQLGSLKHLGKKIPFSCRKLIASVIILSKLMYQMPLWGILRIYLRKVNCMQQNGKMDDWTS